MKQSSNRRHFFWTIVMGLMLATAVPATALAQGHGRGHGKGNDGGIGNVGNIGRIGWPTRNTTLPNHDRKCAKFKNCHDASEGRWDGRGPRGNRVGNILSRRWNRNHSTRNNFLRNRGRRVGRRVLDNR